MSTSTEKPNAIIFGGLNNVSRALAALLVPLEGDRLVGHLRIVDKFSVAPPTTYLGAEFPKVLQQLDVEYKQANLTIPSAVSSAFDPPKDKAAYSYVFDFSGELRHDRADMIFINATFKVARLIGTEAAKRKVKAYVRVQPPFYTSSSKGSHDEKEDIKPAGTIGTWWHETLRGLAAIEDLNLVILRFGFVYGPYITVGILSTVLTVAAVYGHMKQPMKTLWAPGKDAMNSVHVYDVAGAIWACAEWMGPLGRKEANTIAGEEIIFHNDKKIVAEVDGMSPHNQKLIAPLFNIVDDSNLTLAKAGSTVTALFGTTHEFYNMAMNTVAKFKLDDVVEEINEHHVGGWTEMLQASNPPIQNTPLSAYMDTHQLAKHGLGYSNAKIKEIIQYKLKRPQFTQENLKEVVNKWKAEGSWPILDGE